MGNTIQSLSGGYCCTYNNEGITCIQKNENKDYQIFFPYGSISKIKLGFLGLDIRGDQQVFFYPVAGKAEKNAIKEMVSFAQQRMKTAPKAKATFIDYMALKQDFLNRYAAERQFYQACVGAGLTLSKNSSKADTMRAMLIASQNGLQGDEQSLVDLYLTGQCDVERLAEHERCEELFNRAKALERYLSYHGREKDVRVTEDMYNYYVKQRDYIISGKALPLQQEHDWATMGGIASAIAGGAAGVAVASDLQAQNAAIRAKNNQMRSDYIRMSLPTLTKVNEEIELWRKKAEKAKIELVDDSSPEDLFKKITISEGNVNVLYDGSFVVTAKALIRYVTIFDSVWAEIDGSITAVVFQDGVMVGEAPMVLPESRTMRRKTGQECMLIGAGLTRSADPEKTCEIKFKCRDLWAVEV